jgi:hypothetical protein
MSIQAGQCFHGGNLVLANVASAVSAGDELGASTTDGQLEGGSDGYSALTDAGDAQGLATNESVGSGLAAVPVKGTVSYEADETISPGDAVGIDSGTLRTANSGDGSSNVIGIAGRGAGESAGEDYADGDDVPVHILE